jgi:hypothetical protein
MVRFRIEAVITILLAALAIITLIWPDWIEITLGADPDGGSGETRMGRGDHAWDSRAHRRPAGSAQLSASDTLTRVSSLGANG